MRKIAVLIILFMTWIPRESQGQEASPHALALYAGRGTPSPLLGLARLSNVEWSNDMLTTLSWTTVQGSLGNALRWETELGLSKHWEARNAFSGAGALLIRWLKTPWSTVFPGSFAFGNGLSYATEIPELEGSRLERNSKLLYHLSLEFTFNPAKATSWEMLFRIHHRSGAYGLFDEVVGGSDYVCLGVRHAI